MITSSAAFAPKAKALFQAGRFVGVESDRALFGLPNETHRIRCEEVRGEIESALSDHFGRPVPLALIVDPDQARPHRSRLLVRRPPRRTGPRTAHGSSHRRSRHPASRASSGSRGGRGSVRLRRGPNGEVAEVDNSAEARVLQAFPGAEEVR